MLPRRLAYLLLGLVSLVGVAAGDDEADDAPLVVRLLDAGALTRGQPHYIPEGLGPHAPETESWDPLGAEGEEPILPYGTIDEVIGLVKQSVDPEVWDLTAGPGITALGERTLVVRAAAPLADRVARCVARLEAEALVTVTLEVRAVRAPSEAGGGDLEDLPARDGPSVVVSGIAGQRVVGFAGHVAAYLDDYDAEVAKGAEILDPRVGVANWGLLVSARTQAVRGAAGLRTNLSVRLALPEDLRTHAVGEGAVVELPSWSHVAVETDLLLEPGRWTVAPGNAPGAPPGRWILLVRATASRPPAAEPRAVDALEPAPALAGGSRSTRGFGIADLIEPLPTARGWGLHLVPSGAFLGEEIIMPGPLLSPYAIRRLVREALEPGAALGDASFVDHGDGTLRVTATAKGLDHVEALLALLRRHLLWSIDAEARFVRMPAHLGRNLVGPDAPASYLLNDAGRQALERALREGDAREIECVHVTCLSGSRGVVTSGRRVSYVQDYEVEVAEQAALPNPVVASFTSGVEVDLAPTLCSTGDAVNLGVYVTRTQAVEPMREIPTPHGPIDAPALEILRLRGNLRVPLGETAVVGAGSDGGRMLLVLVKPVLRPYGR